MSDRIPDENFFLLLSYSVIHSHNDPRFTQVVESLWSAPSPPGSRKQAVIEHFNKLKLEYEDYIREVESGIPRPISSADPHRIYIDGCWDIMHSGHYNAIRQAKMLGQTLVVGIHSDEEIARNKGMPVMNEEERISMVRACKWVDEIVLDAPYSPTSEFLDRNNCLYIAHGDDTPINCDGQDAYGQMKDAGRFKIIKRTEGISTTSIVGKLLLMTRDPHETVTSPLKASEISSMTHFLTTSRRISEFSNRDRRIEGRIVYIDGSFDLFRKIHSRYWTCGDFEEGERAGRLLDCRNS
jgi:cytidyltransferase-like protein